MVTQRTPSTQGMLEPNAPPWAGRFLLKLVGFFVAQWPTSPLRLWQVRKADLPPPADWPWAVVAVTDQNCIAVSTGVSWQKIAFGGPV